MGATESQVVREAAHGLRFACQVLARLSQFGNSLLVRCGFDGKGVLPLAVVVDPKGLLMTAEKACIRSVRDAAKTWDEERNAAVLGQEILRCGIPDVFQPRELCLMLNARGDKEEVRYGGDNRYEQLHKDGVGPYYETRLVFSRQKLPGLAAQAL